MYYVRFHRYIELQGFEHQNILLFTNIHTNKFLQKIFCDYSIWIVQVRRLRVYFSIYQKNQFVILVQARSIPRVWPFWSTVIDILNS